jgi:uncharacterized tellurite resistance protein B-like protein
MSIAWKCPKCGIILRKGNPVLADALKNGSEILGTATCANCGARYSQHDVYSGKYDVPEPKYVEVSDGVNGIFVKYRKKVMMEYFESPVSAGDGRCSDDGCPCGEFGVIIPRGLGYIYISSEAVKFRSDCLSWGKFLAKMERLGEKFGGKVQFIIHDKSVINAILVCEKGARRRNLNLSVAAADAKYWWETGKVPLRATPLADVEPETKSKAEKPQEEKREDIYEILMDAICCVMYADGKVTSKEREAVHNILKKTKAPWTKEDINKRIDGFLERAQKEGMEKIVQATCENLPEFKRRKKQEVLKVCLDFMARADGIADELEKKLIEKFKTAVEIDFPDPADYVSSVALPASIRKKNIEEQKQIMVNPSSSNAIEMNKSSLYNRILKPKTKVEIVIATCFALILILFFYPLLHVAWPSKVEVLSPAGALLLRYWVCFSLISVIFAFALVMKNWKSKVHKIDSKAWKIGCNALVVGFALSGIILIILSFLWREPEQSRKMCYVCGKPAYKKAGPYVNNRGQSNEYIWLCNDCPAPPSLSATMGGKPLSGTKVSGSYSRTSIESPGIVFCLGFIFLLVISPYGFLFFRYGFPFKS